MCWNFYQVTVEGEAYHKSCFKCSHGGCSISPSNYAALEGILYCKHHFSQLFKEKGSYNHLTKCATMKRASAPPPELWSRALLSAVDLFAVYLLAIICILWKWIFEFLVVICVSVRKLGGLVVLFSVLGTFWNCVIFCVIFFPKWILCVFSWAGNGI